MSGIRWILVFLSMLPMAVSDLLFLKVSVAWSVSGTLVILILNLAAGWNGTELGLCFLPGMILWLLAKLSRGIGEGDILAVFLLGGICGCSRGLEILLGGSMLCLVYMVIIRKNRAKETPFLPWLLLAAYLNWLFGL